VVLALVVAAAAAGMLPRRVAYAYGLLSLLSFGRYFLDKRAATRGERRTPESSLHLLDFLGGWPGGLIAQQVFRHKTIKNSFQAMFWLTVVANIGLAAFLLHEGLIPS
jgi:uncharacterized membrane protein YsdA (DUF1294 family)